MGWPQITMIALVAMGVGWAFAKDGEPKGNYSAGGALFSAAVEIGLLYAGGCFS